MPQKSDFLCHFTDGGINCWGTEILECSNDLSPKLFKIFCAILKNGSRLCSVELQLAYQSDFRVYSQIVS